MAVRVWYGEAKIWVGQITHKHGEEVYVARSRPELYEKVAGFCRDWWEDEGVPGSVSDYASMEELVDAYFSHQSEAGEEYFSTWHSAL